MNKVYPKVELAANTLIIVVAFILGGVLIQKYFLTASALIRLQLITGTKINIHDINWSNHPQTVVLALQTSCHLWNESAPFYKQIINQVKDKNIKIVAVLPRKVEEVKKFHLTEGNCSTKCGEAIF